MLQFGNILQRVIGSAREEPDLDRANVPPVDLVQVENSQVRRDRALLHLLRLNHHQHSVLYSGNESTKFHNHCPHTLGTAYLLGADDEQLHKKYEEVHEELEPWQDSPNEVTKDDWHQHLGNWRYQRAYMDFFEDELVRQGYDWKKVLMEFMLEGEKPLIEALFCGIGHPLIHFGYAIELNSREVAMEALTLAASCYDFLPKFLKTEAPARTEKLSTDIAEILARVRDDSRFTGLFEEPGQQNYGRIFKEYDYLVLEYLNQLDLGEIDLASLLEMLTKTAVLMLMTTHQLHNPQYDFFICHVLTSVYGARTVLPVLSSKHQRAVLKSHWLFTLAVYIMQMRPSIKPELINNVDTKGREWDYVAAKVTEHIQLPDTHYMKALRIMRDSGKLYTHDEGFYLKAGLKLAHEYEHWIGFEGSKERLDIKF